jgi:hypothetical protein
MNLYIVQEVNTSEVIGVYDTFSAAKIAGEIWTSSFYIVEKTLNATPDVGKSFIKIPSSVIYDSTI